jgi:hypothetical protein
MFASIQGAIRYSTVESGYYDGVTIDSSPRYDESDRKLAHCCDKENTIDPGLSGDVPI